jgi:NADPH:quinone reductase-like Zn-dependent oxidoreductase
MRQVWIPRIGGPEVLEVREAADPEPRAGEVRVRVAASGVNFADCLARMGLYPDGPKLPAVVGYEVAGEIDRIGPGVETLTEGTRVVALTRFGGYADTVIVPTVQVLPIPHTLSFEQAAGIPVNYVTAWIMLVWIGNVHPGERVLVHAVAGGVGQAALQICRWRGATVIGTASAGKHARLAESGVAHCIDYHTQDFETEISRITGGEGVDVVLDAVGGRSFARSYRCLGPLGRLFVFGVSSFAPETTRSIPAAIKGLLTLPRYKPISLMNDNRGVFGVNVGHLWERSELLARMLADIVQLCGDGVLSPVIDRVFPFDRAGEAHAYIQARKNFGKVLLVP